MSITGLGHVNGRVVGFGSHKTEKQSVFIRAQKGIAFDLYVRRKGNRYRPLLVCNLTKEQADEEAIKMIAKIQQNEPSPVATRSTSTTLQDFLPLYWQTMHVKKRLDLARPEPIIDTHLLPRFGERRLKKIGQSEYDPLEFWRIATVALNTGLREAKILEIDLTWMRKRDDGWWLILPRHGAARNRQPMPPSIQPPTRPSAGRSPMWTENLQAMDSRHV